MQSRMLTLAVVAESVTMLVAVRLALIFVGLAGVRAQWLPVKVPGSRDDRLDAGRLARALRMAARLAPFTSCLTQAQAGQIVLARRGVASTVCLGVRQAASGALAAHAWLVVDGRLVLGGAPRDISSFRPLAELAPVR